jgi:hypothetical protein
MTSKTVNPIRCQLTRLRLPTERKRILIMRVCLNYFIKFISNAVVYGIERSLFNQQPYFTSAPQSHFIIKLIFLKAVI